MHVLFWSVFKNLQFYLYSFFISYLCCFSPDKLWEWNRNHISSCSREEASGVFVTAGEQSSWELPVREETLWKTHVLHYLPLPSVGCDLLLHISVLPALVSLYSAVKVAVFLVALKWWLRQCPKLFLFIAGHCVWLLSSFWLWGRWLNICNW